MNDTRDFRQGQDLQLFSELTVRHLANMFIVASVFVVLGATLYPFDFTTDGFNRRLVPFLHPVTTDMSDLEGDIITNILLFLPVGFGFGILATRKRLTLSVAFLLVTLAGGMLSLTVELLQLFLPFRFSSFADVASNAAGTAAGFVLFRSVGKALYRPLTLAVQQANRGHTTGWLAAGFVFYLCCVLLIAQPLQYSSFMYEFDFTYPLLVGNEPGGERPWNGSVSDLLFTSHELSEDGIRNYLAGRAFNASDEKNIVARYVFHGGGPYTDLHAKNPPLEWKGTLGGPPDTLSARITAKRWLQSAKPVPYLSSMMATNNRFTMCVTAASAGAQVPDQSARIVSISSDVYHRSFALIQFGRSLVVRFRSMTTGVNGTNPQFIIPDVFRDTLPHRIVVTLSGAHLRVCIDDVARTYELELGPGFALLHRFLPASSNLDISNRLREFHNYVFDAIVFLPLGYMVGAFLNRIRSLLLRIVAGGAGIWLPPLLLERVLQQMTGRESFTYNLWIGIAMLAITATLTIIRHARRPMPAPQDGSQPAR